MVAQALVREQWDGQYAQPALARGELHCVGATTLDEYRKLHRKGCGLMNDGFQKVSGSTFSRGHHCLFYADKRALRVYTIR